PMFGPHSSRGRPTGSVAPATGGSATLARQTRLPATGAERRARWVETGFLIPEKTQKLGNPCSGPALARNCILRLLGAGRIWLHFPEPIARPPPGGLFRRRMIRQAGLGLAESRPRRILT